MSDIGNGAGNHWGYYGTLAGTGNGVQRGFEMNITNSGTGTHEGARYDMSGAVTGTQYGAVANITNSGAGLHIGFFGDVSGGTGTNYGVYARSDAATGTTNYGIYATASGATTNYAGMFQGNVVPSANNTYDLGTTTLRWQDVWCNRNAFNGSDIRLKKEVYTTEYGLKELMKLRPVNYTWRNNNRQDIGFIAQEIKEVLPELVMESKDSINTLLMNYQGVIPVLVKAVQEQQQLIDKQNQAIKKLEADNIEIRQLRMAFSEKEKQLEALQQKINKIDQLLGNGFHRKKEK